MNSSIKALRQQEVADEARRGQARQDRELDRKGRTVWWLALTGALILPLLHELARVRALHPLEQPYTLRYTNLETRQAKFHVKWLDVPSRSTLPRVLVGGSSTDVILEGDPRTPHGLGVLVTASAGTQPGFYNGNLEFFDPKGTPLDLSLPLCVVVQDPFAPFRWGLLLCCGIWALYAGAVYRCHPAPRGWLRYMQVGTRSVRPEDQLSTQSINRRSAAWFFLLLMTAIYLGLWRTFRPGEMLPYTFWEAKFLLGGIPVIMAMAFLATRPYRRSYVSLRDVAGQSFPESTLIFSRGLFSSRKRLGLTLRARTGHTLHKDHRQPGQRIR